jgi:16S rRNA (guanine527-N7)-methyltransferase
VAVYPGGADLRYIAHVVTRNSSAGSWERVISESLGALELAASPEAQARLGRYLSLVVDWGARMDLTAARSTDELIDLSLADAAVIAREELRSGTCPERWVDVGTGGGAPGIPLLILLSAGMPSVAGTLVEPRTKRVAFLRSCVGELGLDRVDVLRARSEVLPARSAGAAVARATLPPPEWLQEGTRLATHAVWVLLAREAPPSQAGWVVERDVSYRWPLTGAERRALRYVPSGI